MQFTPTQKRVGAWLLIALLALLALWALGPVLTPFVVAAVLAYALTPLVDRLDALGNGRVPRVLAVVVVELLFILALLCVLLLVVPVVAKEMPLLRQQLPLLLERLDGTLAPWLAQFGINVSLDVASLKAQMQEYLNANWSDAFPSLLSSLKLGGSVALALIGNAVLIPVALFYLLLDWKPLVARVRELVPIPSPPIRTRCWGSTCAASCW
jgi:predicted PurR-regulated permease PerM